MNQLLCGLALLAVSYTSAQASLTYVKQDDSAAILTIPDDGTATVTDADHNVVLMGHTRAADEDGVRIYPDDESAACPPVKIRFSHSGADNYAYLEVLTNLGGTPGGAGTCRIGAIGGRYYFRDENR